MLTLNDSLRKNGKTKKVILVVRLKINTLKNADQLNTLAKTVTWKGVGKETAVVAEKSEWAWVKGQVQSVKEKQMQEKEKSN